MSEQLPVKEAAVIMAMNYIWRQHWKLKWLTLLLASPMVIYTVKAHAWIPLLSFNLVSWALLITAQVLAQITINRLFVAHVQNQRDSKESDPVKMKAISQHAWIHWGVTVILWYWLGSLIWAPDLFTLTL